ncbi:MAG: signal recognition particle-docking protein FtsY [Firmicutes bacterium]|nr:signal recognition particle-docking protein FtsY [Bacillota bacterium]
MGIFKFFKNKKDDETVNIPETAEEAVEAEAEEDIISEEEPAKAEDVQEEPDAESEPAVQEEPESEPETETEEEPEVSDEPEIIPNEAEGTEEFGIEEPFDEEPDFEEPQEETKKKGFFARLFSGLGKTRNNIMGNLDSVFKGFTKIDEDLYEELEEALIMADLGVETTLRIIENLRKRVKKEHIKDEHGLKTALMEEIANILKEGEDEEDSFSTPAVILIIGVNGVGKTTTIGKLALRYKKEGKTVLLAAADTFRAAAIDQLGIWAERAGIDMIKKDEGSDPASVVFDALGEARKRNTDILICDTAGRLHNKKNLMEELKKISKVIDREYPKAHKETYLVLDATTGQNAVSQAKIFKEAADITGIILTKLDGTAKGGIVIAIKSQLNIPVKYIGVGEQIDDLQKFDAEAFSKALLGVEE